MTKEILKKEYSGEQKPLLSIIIPTRNRAEYAISAINSILKIDSDLLELVVQDNSEEDRLSDYIASKVTDQRLKYTHIKQRLDIIANFNMGLNSATGEYFTFLGDDDGVNPEILDMVSWAKRHNIDAITPPLIADYMWPDFRQKYYGAKESGCLKIRPFSGEITFPEVGQGMLECARSACQNLVNFVGLPKIYYGIVKRECMEKVKENVGNYFVGVSPDMSGAMAVANFVKRLCSVDYPLFIPGSSAKSGAGSSAQKKHHGRDLRDQPHLPDGCWKNWPPVIPKFYSVQTVWAQSGWCAMQETSRNDLLEEFNVPLLHATCAVFNPQYFKFVIVSFYVALSSTGKSAILGSISFFKYYLSTWGMRGKFFVEKFLRKIKPDNVVTISNLADIDIALCAFNKHINREGYQLSTILKSFDRTRP